MHVRAGTGQLLAGAQFWALDTDPKVTRLLALHACACLHPPPPSPVLLVGVGMGHARTHAVATGRHATQHSAPSL